MLPRLICSFSYPSISILYGSGPRLKSKSESSLFSFPSLMFTVIYSNCSIVKKKMGRLERKYRRCMPKGTILIKFTPSERAKIVCFLSSLKKNKINLSKHEVRFRIRQKPDVAQWSRSKQIRWQPGPRTLVRADLCIFQIWREQPEISLKCWGVLVDPDPVGSGTFFLDPARMKEKINQNYTSNLRPNDSGL